MPRLAAPRGSGPSPYAEIPEFRHPRYRVYRSLQQPGRFLVVPSAYRIPHFAATEPPERAFRPAIMVYAVLSEKPEDHRYFFRATLQAESFPYDRRVLEERLVPLLPHKATLVVTYPPIRRYSVPTRPPRSGGHCRKESMCRKCSRRGTASK